MASGNYIGKFNIKNSLISSGIWKTPEVANNIKKNDWTSPLLASGGMISYTGDYRVHTFLDSGTFTITQGSGNLEYLIIGAGGGGGMDMGGGGGGGGFVEGKFYPVKAGDSIPVIVGIGGRGGPAGGTDGQPTVHQYTQSATSGGISSFGNIIAYGGGYGGSSVYTYTPNQGWGSSGASGGGNSGYVNDGTSRAARDNFAAQGSPGGATVGTTYYSSGGGGAGGPGTSANSVPHGGIGKYSDILGTGYYWSGGGGGAAYSTAPGGNGGLGGGGGGAVGTTTGGAGYNNGKPGGGGVVNAQTNRPGGDGGAHTGGGGGGGSHYQQNNRGGQGGSGIVIVRYLIPKNFSRPTIQNFGSYYAFSDGTYASSALEYKKYDPNCVDGVYRVDIPTVGLRDIYCLMGNAYDGGGWMMAMKATRGTTFAYSSTHWTTATVLNETTAINRNDGDAKFHTFNYSKGTDLMALWPDIGAGGSIAGLGMWCWLEKNYAGRFQQTTCTPLYVFQNAARTFINDATLFSGWASGVFSSQTDVRFYGFNWTDNMNCRWGFGWNENGGGGYPFGVMGSDDVSGGIGLSQGSYSAGDIISCCQNTTGINRSARVEIYVR